MKYKVTYYDYDVDSVVTKNCDRTDFSDDTFYFYPVDDPVKIYKAVCIDHPKVTIKQHENKLVISVSGYQYLKNNGYWKTETIIKSVDEE